MLCRKQKMSDCAGDRPLPELSAESCGERRFREILFSLCLMYKENSVQRESPFYCTSCSSDLIQNDVPGNRTCYTSYLSYLCVLHSQLLL
ncbi:hypothetical protein XELAEV_18003029mg [Xenopus laevis]|nr:hypothetical protein XELAEV_18003029mg [Xenopus laevis]